MGCSPLFLPLDQDVELLGPPASCLPTRCHAPHSDDSGLNHGHGVSSKGGPALSGRSMPLLSVGKLSLRATHYIASAMMVSLVFDFLLQFHYYSRPTELTFKVHLLALSPVYMKKTKLLGKDMYNLPRAT